MISRLAQVHFCCVKPIFFVIMHTISDAAYKRLHKRWETFSIENEECAHKDRQHQTLLLRSHGDDQKHRLGFRWLTCTMCVVITLKTDVTWNIDEKNEEEKKAKVSYFCIHYHLSNAVTGLTVISYDPLKKEKNALCCQLPQGLAPTECFVSWLCFSLWGNDLISGLRL